MPRRYLGEGKERERVDGMWFSSILTFIGFCFFVAAAPMGGGRGGNGYHRGGGRGGPRRGGPYQNNQQQQGQGHPKGENEEGDCDSCILFYLFYFILFLVKMML